MERQIHSQKILLQIKVQEGPCEQRGSVLPKIAIHNKIQNGKTNKFLTDSVVNQSARRSLLA